MTEYVFTTDNNEEARRYFKALDMALALNDVERILKSIQKHGTFIDDLPDDQRTACEALAWRIREEIGIIYDSHGINLEELIT